MDNTPKNLKLTICKYCNQDNMMWENHEGRYVLFESYGLPHVCEVREKLVAEKKAADKKQYEDFKAQTMAKVGHKCDACGGHGILLGVISTPVSSGNHCFQCHGTGILSAEQAKHLIMQKRYQIWPSLRYNGNNRWRNRG